MIQKAKGRSANTAETNRFINEGLREEGTPYINFEPKLKAVRGRYSLPFYIEDNMTASPEESSIDNALRNNEKKSGGSDALVHIETDDGPYDIPIGQVDAFMTKRKHQNPRIMLGGEK